MAEQNTFQRILSRLEESDENAVTEKTASENENTQKTAEAKMLEVVRGVANSDKSEKTAETQEQPAQNLQQMAKQAQANEQALMQKQAQSMGAAIADGFMERFAQYDTALADQGHKTASAPDQTAIKEAAQSGYNKAVSDMEKKAEQEYERGYKEQLQAVQKTAAEVHYAGQAVARNLVQHSNK